MEQFTQTDILLLIALCLCILSTIRSFYFGKKLRVQKSTIESTTHTLEAANEELTSLRELKKRFSEFKDDLHTAQLTTEVQKSKHSFNQKTENHRIPARYQYIQSLNDNGMNASEIASILTISPHEAKQLVALAKLSSN